MPLEIIKGPPNSGRTERLRQMYVDSLPRNPVLVVPSVDDIFTWEERFTRESGALIGGRVMHFRDLIGQILDRNPLDRSDIATPLRRRQIVTDAMMKAWPPVGRRLDSQPGLIDAALLAFDELRSEQIDPETYDHRISEATTDGIRGNAGSALEHFGRAYREYLAGMERLGLEDDASLAAAAASTVLDGWESRPVFVAGFDDLTGIQLHLLTRLASVTRVTVAVTHEDNSPAMAVTNRLLARLREYGEDGPPQERLSAAESRRSPLLHEIERRFLKAGPYPDPLKPDRALTLIQASGTRGEAEAVGSEIARLVASGTTPDSIAIAVASPAVNGRGFRDALIKYDVAATLECETPAPATAIGQAVVDLLRAAAPGGSAADLFRYLRGPSGADRDAVDRAEYRVVRAGLASASQAAAIYGRIARTPVPFLAEVSEGEPGEVVCDAARQMIARILQTPGQNLKGLSVETEAQMSTAIQRAVADLESIHGGRLRPGQILDALLSGAISTWAIPTGNTVRIASPYSLRAKRVEHLFMVSLQETDPGAGDIRGGPFLGTAVRETLAMPPPNDPEEQEQYLFHSCLSVPTVGLCLSTRIADEHGKAEYPSPLIDRVKDLFRSAGGSAAETARSGDPSTKIRTIRRTASDILFSLGDAPSEAEVIRSLAVASPEAGPVDPSLLPAGLADRSHGLITRADAVDESTRTLSDISDPENLERLAARSLFSPTALESFTGCPYRWFIERGLNLERFGPEPEYFSRGNLIHDVLSTLFSQRPGERPRPGTLGEWLEVIDPAIEAAVGKLGLDPASGTPETTVMVRKARTDIEGQLRLEAGFDEPRLDPRYFEISFGFDDSEKGPLIFAGDGSGESSSGEWRLCGRIDRIDVSGDPAVGERGAVIDYKSGNGSILSWADTRRKRRLQLQLYLKALKDLWKIVPIAGLYQPVAWGKRRPRGPIDEESLEDVAFMNVFPTDRVDLDTAIDEATADADAAVRRIRSGMIDHDPLSCPDHFEHAAVPDRSLASGRGREQE